MKKIVKLLSILCLPLLLVTCFIGGKNVDVVNAESVSNNVFATSYSKPSENPIYRSMDYVIDEYKVDVNVGENNVYYITENITAYFNKYKHGIKRYIPIKNEIKRQDGSEDFYLAKVKNIRVSESVSVDYNEDFVTLTIGDENRTIIGSKNYIISYTFDAGKDLLKDKDEFYFNLIGTKWDTAIGNVSFSISMPKEFDATKLGFAYGAYGSGSSTNISYTVDGNKITGSYNGVLEAYNGITVRLELPEGYFTYKISSPKYVYFILPTILALIAFVLWFIFGRDNGVVKTVEFYPPYDFNSLEVAFNYKGRVSNKDVVSLIVYLASKGYIKIIDDTDKASNFKLDKGAYITLEKLKEYTGDNQCEKDFMLGLFKSNTKITLKDVPKDFYQTLSGIKATVTSKENKQEIFNNTTVPFVLSIIALIVSICMLIMTPLIEYYDFEMAIGILVLYAMVSMFVVIPSIIFRNDPTARGGLMFAAIFTVFVSALMTKVMPLALIFKVDKPYLVGFICGIGCVAVELLCMVFMNKRNEKGNEILGKILGFKQFLQTAEKDKLETLVNENPSYFYDILPYTYVLGVSKKWIKKFEGIALPEPDWYYGSSFDSFDAYIMVSSINNCMTKTMNSISNTVTNQQMSSNSSRGGGFSGGGFSGGGGGGGGGGSW